MLFAPECYNRNFGSAGMCSGAASNLFFAYKGCSSCVLSPWALSALWLVAAGLAPRTPRATARPQPASEARAVAATHYYHLHHWQKTICGMDGLAGCPGAGWVCSLLASKRSSIALGSSSSQKTIHGCISKMNADEASRYNHDTKKDLAAVRLAGKTPHTPLCGGCEALW
jgi:hypothetical protein